MASIRDVDPERDAEAIVTILRDSAPSLLMTPRSWLHRVESLPARAESRGFVAEDGGELVANGYAFRNFFSSAPRSVACFVVVAASHRRRGIAGELWERVEQHAHSLGASTLTTLFEENAAGVAFARRLGFREERAETISALDPRTVHDPVPEIDLRPLGEADPRDAYEVDMDAMLDAPSLEPLDRMPYEEWEQHVLANPLFTPDGSFLAYVDGEPAALALLTTDGERAMSNFTGTARAYRGRGLARATKLATIHWAAGRGVSTMITMNDERNAPMLAVNRRLGYRPFSRRVEYARGLDDNVNQIYELV